VAGGAIGTSGMPLTASGRERPPDSDATLSFGSLCAHRSVNPRGNASAYTPAKPETVATPDPAVGPTRGLQVTRRQSGTAVSEDGGSADHCPNQLVQDQLFTGTGRACGRERKKPV